MVVRVGGQQRLGGVAVGQRGKGEEGHGGRRIQACQGRVVVMALRERERQIMAGRGGAAAEAASALKQALLLLLTGLLLILTHLRETEINIRTYASDMHACIQIQ